MKRRYISIAALLLCARLMTGQVATDHAAQSVSVEVLAQMSALQQDHYNQLVNDLKSGSEESVSRLINRINTSGKGSDVQGNWALSGLSHFVVAKGEESARLAVANAYLKALDRVEELEKKEFIIRQLQLIGRDESVEALSVYLTDEGLSASAAQALAAIKSETAVRALKAALVKRRGTPKTQKEVIRALGDAEAKDAEELLTVFLGSADEELQQVTLYALSRVGTKASLKLLGEAAEKVGYAHDKSGATEAYCTLLRRLALLDDAKVVAKAAADLMKRATEAGQESTREAALQILLSVKAEDRVKLLQGAMKDPGRSYRSAALTFASDYADASLYIELMKTMAKAKPEVKVDLLNWLSRECKTSAKQNLLKTLEIRFDLTLQQLLIDQLKNPDFDVKQAVVWALTRIGNQSVIPVLAQLLAAEEKPVVLLAQKALSVFPGDIDHAVARVIPMAKSDAGKVAGLELLAMRKANGSVNTVISQTRSDQPEVKTAAYKALKDVVTEKDLTLMCGMLETAEAVVVEPLQQAVVSAIRQMNPAQQAATISHRMIQAGESKKHLYYNILATTGEQSALDLIVEGYRQSQSTVKEAAMEALLRWEDPRAADYLYQMAKDSSDAQMNLKALRRYVTWVSSSGRSDENRLIDLRKAMEIASTGEMQVLVLQQIRQVETLASMLYAAEFLESKDPAVCRAAANAVWSIAHNHPEYVDKEVRSLLNRIGPMPDGEEARSDKLP